MPAPWRSPLRLHHATLSADIVRIAIESPVEELVALLACPACGSSFSFHLDRLDCAGCERTFPCAGRVPDFVVADDLERDRASSRTRRLVRSAIGNPRLYDLLQELLGGKAIATRMRRELRDLDGGATVLDVGAGTGMVQKLMPDGTKYIWLDNDRHKLKGFLARSTSAFAVLGDAARLPMAEGAVEWTVMVAVTHHLPDDVLGRCLGEAARVTRDRFVFVDAVRGPRIRSRLLWKADRGRFPRTEPELVTALSETFDFSRIECFSGIHDYVLCVGSPRRPTRRPRTPNGDGASL